MKIVEEKEQTDINLTDVNHGISDMLTSFRMDVNEDRKKGVVKGTGKKQPDDLDSIVDELV